MRIDLLIAHLMLVYLTVVNAIFVDNQTARILWCFCAIVWGILVLGDIVNITKDCKRRNKEKSGELSFKIKINKSMVNPMCAFGIGIIHLCEETYFYIHFFNRSLCIGYIY